MCGQLGSRKGCDGREGRTGQRGAAGCVEIAAYPMNFHEEDEGSEKRESNLLRLLMLTSFLLLDGWGGGVREAMGKGVPINIFKLAFNINFAAGSGSIMVEPGLILAINISNIIKNLNHSWPRKILPFLNAIMFEFCVLLL